MNTLNVVEAVFFAALEKATPDERDAYLKQACNGDANLRRCVERLLNAHPKADGVVPVQAPGLSATIESPPIEERPGSIIGPYKLLQQLGEGGFGVVFMAEQEQPVRRRVALKIIKPGMDSKQVIARFEAERQALALMDHPSIARVLDGGTTESGRPYFVMELVKGVPITEFCDKNRLAPRERLELFIQVCNAVQHAHQKGVIHRDIKPSNVLVTLYDDQPVPKVIDFGVAKAIEQKLTEQTMFTRVGQVIGTLEYMSPEQATLNALDVDTRSDVYALGVLLYELLTGTTPLNKERLEGVAFLEMLRLIREEEPPRPSTRLSQSADALPVLALSRKSDSQKLPNEVRGELDWITMKALEKDRTRRYNAASALAADVQRYLKDEHVEACPPTFAYRLQKYARKHKAFLGMACTVAALLLIGIAATGWQAVRATRAETLATDALDLALLNEGKASKSEKTAQNERDQAQRERDDARAAREQVRKTLYISDMNLVQALWEADDPERITGILQRHLPEAGEADVRGFEWHYWDRQCHQHIREVRVAFSHLRAACSGDGSRLALIRAMRHEDSKFKLKDDGTIRLELAVIDVTAGKPLFAVPMPRANLPGKLAEAGPFSLASTGPRVVMSHDGKRMATYVPAGEPVYPLIVWDAVSGKQLLTIKEPLMTAVLSPDGSRLAVELGGFDEPLTPVIYDVATGKVMAKLENGTEKPYSLSGEFSPDSKRFAMTAPRSVRIWDANTGKEMLTIPLDSLPVACTFSPDGKRLAIARSTGLRAPMSQVLIHDAADGKELAAIPGLQAIKALCFSPDGSRLAGWGGIRITGVGGPTVQIWNAVTGAPLQTIKGLTAIHPIAFSGDGKQLHTLDHWSMLQTWAVADMPSEKTNVSRRIIEPSPDGRRFVEYVRNPFGGAEDGPVAKEIIVRDWDGREIKRFDEHAGSPISAAWSGDGKVVASIAFQPETELANCYVWEADTGRIRMEVKVTQRTLALSRDGGRLATRDRSGIVKVFDTRNGKEIFEAPVNSGIFLLSPDGRRVATAERSGKAFMPQMAKAAIQIWDVDARMEVFRDDNTFVGSLAFNRDGGKLAYSTQPTGTFTTLVKVRDAQTGAEAGSLMAPFIATKVVFSPDDKLLALHSSQIGGTSFQGVITLVDAASLKEVGRLEGRQGALAKVVFSPDGKRLASSTGRTVADPAEIRLWDLESRRELLSIKDVGLLEHLLFDHGGQRLIGTRSFFQSGERMTIWDGRPRAEAAK